MSWTDLTTTEEKIAALKTDIAALEDSMSGASSKDIDTYTINGRSLKRIPMTEKIELHNFLTKKLNALQVSKSIADGDGNPRKIKVKFV